MIGEISLNLPFSNQITLMPKFSIIRSCIAKCSASFAGSDLAGFNGLRSRILIYIKITSKKTAIFHPEKTN